MKQPESTRPSGKPTGTKTPESRRQRKYRQRRESIIDAARKVFERKGYENASIGEIAGEADFAKGSIYYYFANKSALLDAVIGDEIEKVRGRFQKVTAEKGNSAERLSLLVHEILKFYERNFALFRILIAPLASPEPPQESEDTSLKHQKYIDLFQRNRKDLIGLIKSAQKEGSVTAAVDPEEAADLLHGLINATVNRWDRAGRKDNLPEKNSSIMGVFLNGVAARPEGSS
jgi:AcrR family transcriptional regulator